MSGEKSSDDNPFRSPTAELLPPALRQGNCPPCPNCGEQAARFISFSLSVRCGYCGTIYRGDATKPSAVRLSVLLVILLVLVIRLLLVF